MQFSLSPVISSDCLSVSLSSAPSSQPLTSDNTFSILRIWQSKNKRQPYDSLIYRYTNFVSLTVRKQMLVASSSTESSPVKVHERETQKRNLA